jgi:hypothetical protein
MNMKREFAIAGLALVVSILLSSPSIAQTAPEKAKPSAEHVAEATTDAEPAFSLEEMSLDDAILFASSPEDRIRVLMRCAGPPPRIAPEMASLEPSTAPAVILAQ